MTKVLRLSPTASLGERVAYYRNIRGYGQLYLAERAGVSVATVRAVERGARGTSSGVLNALARALSVHPNELTGEPYVSDLEQDGLHPLIQPLRYALDGWDVPNVDLRLREGDQIAAGADRVLHLVRATELATAAGELPGLIEEATAAGHQRGEWATLASLYRSAYDVAIKLGYPDLASLALERMGWAAEHASDAAVVAIRQYMRALVHHRAGDYALGLRLIADGSRLLEQADPGRTTEVVTGQLHLGGAVLAARSQDEETATWHLREAERIAAGTGEAVWTHALSFGPTNVILHRVSVLSELGQYHQAIEAGTGVEMPEGWPASRAAGFHIDLALARLTTTDTTGALQDLSAAYRKAPQQTRYSPIARRVSDALRRAETARDGTAAHLAARMGV